MAVLAQEGEREELKPQDSKAPEVQAMNEHIERGMSKAFQVIKNSGGLYPFGWFEWSDGKEKLVAYRKKEEKEEVPPADQWLKYMFVQMRKTALKDTDIVMASVYRQTEIETEKGEKVPGLWAFVDHRDHRPWVIFLPFIKGEDGKHKPGEMIYYATEERIFRWDEPESEPQEAESAEE